MIDQDQRILDHLAEKLPHLAHTIKVAGSPSRYAGYARRQLATAVCHAPGPTELSAADLYHISQHWI